VHVDRINRRQQRKQRTDSRVGDQPTCSFFFSVPFAPFCSIFLIEGVVLTFTEEVLQKVTKDTKVKKLAVADCSFRRAAAR